MNVNESFQQKVLSHNTLPTRVEDTFVIIYPLLINTQCIVMMKKKDRSYITNPDYIIISGLRIGINNLRKGGKELVNI